MRRHDTVKLRTKTPASPVVLRRRAVLAEAGLEHGVLAEAIERLDGISTSRLAVTNCLSGHFSSERIQGRIVELLQMAFRQIGRPGRAEQITHDYMGWPPPTTSGRMRENVLTA